MYAGLYIHTTELLRLRDMSPVIPPLIPPELYIVNSPLRRKWGVWADALANHPDQDFADFILRGIWYGFRIGFNHEQNLVQARRNTPSAGEHPEVVEQYLTKEISAGRIIGPFPVGSIHGLQVSRMGVIPKGHTPGK